MTNSEPQTHLDLADPVHPALRLQSVVHLARKIMSATLLSAVSHICTPTRQVLRRTEFLGSLAISYVLILIMIMVACPTSTSREGSPDAGGRGCPFPALMSGRSIVRVRKPPAHERRTSVLLQR